MTCCKPQNQRYQQSDSLHPNSFLGPGSHHDAPNPAQIWNGNLAVKSGREQSHHRVPTYNPCLISFWGLIWGRIGRAPAQTLTCRPDFQP